MTVYDFVDLMIEPGYQETTIFDVNTQEDVFSGRATDIPDEYMDAEIQTIDLVGVETPYICLNVDNEF